jgi:hypothetical protein
MTTRQLRFMTISVLAHGSDNNEMIQPDLFGKINLLTPIRCGRTSWLTQDIITDIENIAINVVKNPHTDNVFKEISTSLKRAYDQNLFEYDRLARKHSRDARACAFPMESSDDIFNIEQPSHDHSLTFATAESKCQGLVKPHVYCIDASDDINIKAKEIYNHINPLPRDIKIGDSMLLSELSRILINQWELDYINIIDLSCRVMENRHDVTGREERTRRVTRTTPFKIGDMIKVYDGDTISKESYKIVKIDEKGVTIAISPTSNFTISYLENIVLSGGQSKKRNFTKKQKKTRKNKKKQEKYINSRRKSCR